MDVEIARGGRDGLVVLLHAVIGAPELRAVRRAEERGVTGAEYAVPHLKQRLAVLPPVRGIAQPVRIAPVAARVFERAEAVAVGPAPVAGIDDEQPLRGINEERAFVDRGVSRIGWDKLPVVLGSGDHGAAGPEGPRVLKLDDVQHLPSVHPGAAEVLLSVRGGPDGRIDREDVRGGLAFEPPRAHRIVRFGLHDEKPLLAGLLAHSAACVDIPPAVRAAVHLRGPEFAPDPVARTVRRVDHPGIPARADRGGMAAAEELENAPPGEEGVIIPGDGIPCEKGIGGVIGRDRIAEGFHFMLLSGFVSDGFFTGIIPEIPTAVKRRVFPDPRAKNG